MRYNESNTREKRVNIMSENYVVSKGMVVGLAYTLFVDNAIEDSAPVSNPLEYLQGYNNLIEGLEKQLEGLKVGDKKTAYVEPEEGYGEYNEEMIITLDRELFPENFPIEIGRPVPLMTEDENQITGFICDFNEVTVTVDLNHPMAGKTLHFECEIVSLRPGTEEELEHGHIHVEDSGCCSDCSSCGHHCH